ncbi:MAG: hypothetical protein L3I99_03245 [Sulfurimonas sp.]|nr:hypothetical protein [Sulfurimonas sp.]
MKYIVLFLALLILSGCSHKKAFSNFDMNLEQQLSAQYFKKTKLVKNNKIIGTFSSIYLNEIYPDKYNKNEYFYISIYLKDTQNKENYVIELNKNSPLEIEKLSNDNKFSKLVNERNKWSKYYLVSFEETGKVINLTFGNDQLTLASIMYQKDEQ